MDTAVDVGAIPFIEIAHSVDHDLRLLGGGRIVEIDQGVTVRLLVEGREVRAYALDIEGCRVIGGGGWSRHSIPW